MSLVVDAERWCEAVVGRRVMSGGAQRCGDVAWTLCGTCGMALCEMHEVVCRDCHQGYCSGCDHVCVVPENIIQAA
jgi:predicted sulfurtransferase